MPPSPVSCGSHLPFFCLLLGAFPALLRRVPRRLFEESVVGLDRVRRDGVRYPRFHRRLHKEALPVGPDEEPLERTERHDDLLVLRLGGPQNLRREGAEVPALDRFRLPSSKIVGLHRLRIPAGPMNVMFLGGRADPRASGGTAGSPPK